LRDTARQKQDLIDQVKTLERMNGRQTKELNNTAFIDAQNKKIYELEK